VYGVGGTVNSTAPTPPNSGDGANTPAYAGSSGVVVISYPDIYEKATVAGGVTYTLGDTGGNYVYQFTAGSGSITFP
jgi:hypothetical protein